MAVLSGPAKPSRPPTRSGPEGDPARSGSEPLDPPPTSPPGELSGMSPAMEEGKTTRLEGRGAGRSHTSPNPTARTAADEVATERSRSGSPPAIELHMADSPARPNAAQTTTYNPKVVSTAWAAATAMRVTEPARENPRSRRDGTSKEWVTCIQVNSTARGPSTAARSPMVVRSETDTKNHTNAPETATARISFRPGGGLARRR